MTNMFLKVDKRITNLSDNAAYLSVLLYFIQFTGKDINLTYLAKCLKLSEFTISHLLADIEKLGIIKRSYIYTNSTYNGAINKKLKFDMQIGTFFKVDSSFIQANYSNETKGFALKLRTLAFDDTVTIKMNKRQMSEKLGISYQTFLKHVNQLKFFQFNDHEQGYIFLEYFPQTDFIHLSDSHKETIKEILKHPASNKLYFQTKWFVDHKIYTLKDADLIYDEILGGILGLNKTNNLKSIYDFSVDF